jgi:hypothetical protein
MTSVHCGSHDRVVHPAPEGDACSTNEQAAESCLRDGSDNSELLQVPSPLAIVQTYSVEESVPKGNNFERWNAAALIGTTDFSSLLLVPMWEFAMRTFGSPKHR